MSKPTDSEIFLARLAVGYHSQLRYYKTLILCGYDWAVPVYNHFLTLHDRALRDMDDRIEEMSA